jgi:hypothetical protein
MRKYHIAGLILLSFFLLVPFSFSAETVPHSVGGITLGARISEYPDIVQSNFMKEVVITDRHGFRKGVISYGVCRYKNEILRIRLKYADKSKSFYKKLLKMFRTKFGPPDSWNGDSFGLLHVWKWHFIDKDRNRVSMSLQFNAKDPNETIGNVIKLSFPERIEEERLCFNRMCEEVHEKSSAQQKNDPKKSDWSYLIPD